MKKASMILLAALYLNPIFAQEKLSLTTPSADCVCDPTKKDSYEEPIKFGFGTYAGQCVDSCRFRRARILNEGKGLHELHIANLLHQKEFWSAKIPIDKVEEIDIGFEEFLPRINHVFLRFHFFRDAAIELRSQVGTQKKTIHDVVFSAEGIPPKTKSYSFFESALGRYLFGYRILSIEEAKDRMVYHLKHHVTQYRLKLTPEERKRILISAMTISSKQSFASIYQLLSNNCSTAAMDLVEPNHSDWQKAFPLVAPFGALNTLRTRGLVMAGEMSRIQDL